jgi:dUTPase
VVENNCHHNTGTGIRATSTDNRIDRNLTTLNDTGIRVEDEFNLVLHNQSSNNTNNFSISAGNALGTIESITSMNTNKNPHANFDF